MLFNLLIIVYNNKQDELSYLEIASDDIEESTWKLILVKIGAWVILFTLILYNYVLYIPLFF